MAWLCLRGRDADALPRLAAVPDEPAAVRAALHVGEPAAAAAAKRISETDNSAIAGSVMAIIRTAYCDHPYRLLRSSVPLIAIISTA